LGNTCVAETRFDVPLVFKPKELCASAEEKEQGETDWMIAGAHTKQWNE
jgi:hypothetical protein